MFFTSGLPSQTGPVTTAEQYLAYVHTEAKSLPKILQATSSPPHSPTTKADTSFQSPSKSKVHEEQEAPSTSNFDPEPSPVWQQSVCQSYAHLQEALAERTPSTTRKRRRGDQVVPQSLAEWQAHFLSHRPSLILLQRLDFITLVHALTALDEAVTADAPDLAHNCFVNSDLAEWAYCLLAFVQL